MFNESSIIIERFPNYQFDFMQFVLEIVSPILLTVFITMFITYIYDKNRNSRLKQEQEMDNKILKDEQLISTFESQLIDYIRNFRKIEQKLLNFFGEYSPLLGDLPLIKESLLTSHFSLVSLMREIDYLVEILSYQMNNLLLSISETDQVYRNLKEMTLILENTFEGVDKVMEDVEKNLLTETDALNNTDYLNENRQIMTDFGFMVDASVIISERMHQIGFQQVFDYLSDALNYSKSI